MSKNHNKKRNVGLLYEFLVMSISESIVTGDDKRAKKALKLLKRHFKPGTELFREFRLFRALVGTTVQKDSVAGAIIAEARRAARAYDSVKLDREKSLLIRGINHTLRDPGFYNKRVDEYRMYATIQTLLNDWRDSEPDIQRCAKFEDDVTNWLMVPKTTNVLEEQSDDRVDDFVVELMSRKVNKKYGFMNSEQITLLKSYVGSAKSGDQTKLRESIDDLRQETLQLVESYAADGENEPYVVQRLSEIKVILETDVGEIDDAILSQYLRIAQLRQELESDEIK